jgi:hypothetical protein
MVTKMTALVTARPATRRRRGIERPKKITSPT